MTGNSIILLETDRLLRLPFVNTFCRWLKIMETA